MDSGRPDKPPYRERSRAFSKHVTLQDRRVLGEFLASRRVSTGIEQGALASKLGLPQSVLSKIEKGHREVALLEFAAICHELNLDPAIELSSVLQLVNIQNREGA